ncbi:F-box/kelch-repeat protein At1g26930-like [Primulina huaijiensis]|uniref:F-box/kelch-repeat protein At1g26930-like n=1 Tax=Primulina huaijiensis TaxID=1492673 RepID=UPI003CC703BA
MVSVGHHMYIIGGRLCRTNLMVLNSVRRYNTRTDSWDICRPLNSPRFNFACTGTLDQAMGISSAKMYGTSLDKWRFLANMSTKRYKCVGATWQGNIHVLGGFAEKGDGSDNAPGPFKTTRSSAEVYDPQQDSDRQGRSWNYTGFCFVFWTGHNSWEFLARMWDLDIPPYQIVAINEKLFSSGDCLMPWKGHIETYNEMENIWNAVQGSHYDSLSQNFTQDDQVGSMRRMYLTMAPIRNQLFFLTGYKVPGEELRLRNEVHVFDTASNWYGWRSFEPVMEEREKELCGHCCVLKKHVS